MSEGGIRNNYIRGKVAKPVNYFVKVTFLSGDSDFAG